MKGRSRRIQTAYGAFLVCVICNSPRAEAGGGVQTSIDALVSEFKADMGSSRYEQALGAARRLSEIASASGNVENSVVAADMVAEAECELDLWDDARKTIEGVVWRHPENHRARQDLAKIDLKLGRYSEAIDSANQAIALKPTEAADYAYRSRAEKALKQWPGALKDIGKAADLDGRYAGELWNVRAQELWGLIESAYWEPPVLMALTFLVIGAVFWVSKDRIKMKPWSRPSYLAKASGGRLAGKYELQRVIGRGGMGQVYEAKDHSLGRIVAIKKMSEAFARQGAAARELFLKEARTVAALHHPAIVDIFEIVESDADVYLVFEFVRGKPVSQLIAESRRLSPERSLEILKPVCEALEFAHARNLIHRDLKPANIMVAERGGVKLMDFGIARSLGSEARAAAPAEPEQAAVFARTRTVAGTPEYMAPEAENGIVRREGDVYSLGACLYEMLTGVPPYPSGAGLTQKADMDFPPPSSIVPEVPKGIDALVGEALQPDPERRLKTPALFLARLDAAVRSIPPAG